MANIMKTDGILDDLELDELRIKSFRSVIKKGYKVFSGYTMPKCFEDIQKDIEELEVFDDDIWVTSFPKCGTTWTQEMVWCISNNVDLEAAKTPMSNRYHYIEIRSLIDNTYVDIDIKANSFETMKHSSRPRFIKTHLPWDLLPRQIRMFEKRPKIIHVMRNPKDCCVSFYHHHRIFECYIGDFEAFWQLFLKNKIFWTPFAANVLSYWNQRNEPNILLLKFSDMKQDLTAVVKKTSQFLNVSLSDEQITKLNVHLSFDSLKKNKAVNNEDVIEYMKSKNLVADENGQFIRKGQVGDYKTLMSSKIAAIFNEEIESVLNAAGLKL